MLSGLCSYTDVIGRMEDIGLASASDDPEKNTEIIERKILQGEKKLTLDLTAKVQKILNPFPVDPFNNTPAQIVDKATAEAKAFLNECAIVYTIRAIYEEGELRMRFRFQEAGDVIGKALSRWDKLCIQEFDKVCPLLTFDQDGSGTATLLERLFMNRFSSVRVTV